MSTWVAAGVGLVSGSVGAAAVPLLARRFSKNKKSRENIEADLRILAALQERDTTIRGEEDLTLLLESRLREYVDRKRDRVAHERDAQERETRQEM